MSNNKQSSVVDWIEHQVNQQGITHFFSLREILQQAKAMHKEEIKKSYTTGFGSNLHQAEQYYNETFVDKNNEQS